MHISPKIAPFAVLTTFKTGEQVRTLWMLAAEATLQAQNDRRVSSVKSSIVERNDGSAFVPLESITQAGTIDLGVTWASVAQMVALGLENGTEEGKRLARVELDRMARTLAAVGPLLQRAEAFVSGFEDDATQEGVPALLADLRAIIGKA